MPGSGRREGNQASVEAPERADRAVRMSSGWLGGQHYSRTGFRLGTAGRGLLHARIRLRCCRVSRVHTSTYRPRVQLQRMVRTADMTSAQAPCTMYKLTCLSRRDVVYEQAVQDGCEGGVCTAVPAHGRCLPEPCQVHSGDLAKAIALDAVQDPEQLCVAERHLDRRMLLSVRGRVCLLGGAGGCERRGQRNNVLMPMG